LENKRKIIRGEIRALNWFPGIGVFLLNSRALRTCLGPKVLGIAGLLVSEEIFQYCSWQSYHPID
jgi:hypothetical protein